MGRLRSLRPPPLKLGRSCVVVALCAMVAFVGVGASAAARRIPTAVAIVGKGANRALVRVDAWTLEPLRGSRRIRLPRGATFALSPNSSRAAVATEKELFIADTASGRTVWRSGNEGFDTSEGLYWVGTSARPLMIAVGESKFGYEYTAVPSDYATVDTDLEPAAALRDFLVLSGEGGLDFFGRAETFISLDRAPAGNFGVVGDVAGDRVFVVFNAGAVAEVREAVTYHEVHLNGRDFRAIWAGHDQIALWGVDGLGTINTRTWSTSALAPAATGAVGTRYGIVAWNSHAIDGVAVYMPNGRRRLHVLVQKEIENVTALGSYAYARDAQRKQYAINLKTGRVREIRADAELAVPSLVAIP